MKISIDWAVCQILCNSNKQPHKCFIFQPIFRWVIIIMWERFGVICEGYKLLYRPPQFLGNHDVDNKAQFIVLKNLKMVTATLCDASHINSSSKRNNTSAYVIMLRLTIVQIHLYQFWTLVCWRKIYCLFRQN